MDRLTTYRQIVCDVLHEQTIVPISHGQIDLKTVFDEANDRYLVMMVGWNNDDRFYGPLAHIDIIDGKCWVQRDGTAEGLPVLLMEKGIPKEHIVIAYHPVSFRKYMDFAVS